MEYVPASEAMPDLENPKDDSAEPSQEKRKKKKKKQSAMDNLEKLTQKMEEAVAEVRRPISPPASTFQAPVELFGKRVMAEYDKVPEKERLDVEIQVMEVFRYRERKASGDRQMQNTSRAGGLSSFDMPCSGFQLPMWPSNLAMMDPFQMSPNTMGFPRWQGQSAPPHGVAPYNPGVPMQNNASHFQSGSVPHSAAGGGYFNPLTLSAAAGAPSGVQNPTVPNPNMPNPPMPNPTMPNPPMPNAPLANPPMTNTRGNIPAASRGHVGGANVGMNVNAPGQACQNYPAVDTDILPNLRSSDIADLERVVNVQEEGHQDSAESLEEYNG